MSYRPCRNFRTAFWPLSFFQLSEEGSGEVFVAFCDVDRFAFGCAVVVEFEEAVFVFNETVGGGPESFSFGRVGDGNAFGGCGGILEEGNE